MSRFNRVVLLWREPVPSRNALGFFAEERSQRHIREYSTSHRWLSTTLCPGRAIVRDRIDGDKLTVTVHKDQISALLIMATLAVLPAVI